MNTHDKVIEVINHCTGYKVDDIRDDMRLVDDLDMDSLDKLEVAMEIEEGLHIELSDDEIIASETVSDLIKMVERHV